MFPKNPRTLDPRNQFGPAAAAAFLYPPGVPTDDAVDFDPYIPIARGITTPRYQTQTHHQRETRAFSDLLSIAFSTINLPNGFSLLPTASFVHILADNGQSSSILIAIGSVWRRFARSCGYINCGCCGVSISFISIFKR